MFLYNILKSGYYFYRYKKNPSDEMIDSIVTNLKNSGCVIVKFIQWILPRIEIMYDIDKYSIHHKHFQRLECLYDDCNVHSFTHTRKVYKDSFQKNIENDYEDISIVSSGSIGQVYKMKSKKDGIYYALKCIHPNCDFEINFFKYILRFLYFTPYLKDYIRKKTPINLTDFIDDFQEQTNLIKEANNCMRFYREYKDTNLVIIPEIIKVSSNCIIMTYEEGDNFEDLDIGVLQKYKIFLLLKLFIKHNHNSMLQLMHGDIHKGNWKVRINEKYPSIVVYDFGYCWDVSDSILENMAKIDRVFYSFELIDNKKNKGLLDDLSECLNYIIGGDQEENKLLIELHNEFNKLSDNELSNIDVSFLFSFAYKYCKKINLYIDKIILQILIVGNQIENNAQKYSESDTTIMGIEGERGIPINYLDDYTHTRELEQVSVWRTLIKHSGGEGQKLLNTVNIYSQIDNNIYYKKPEIEQKKIKSTIDFESLKQFL